MSPRARVVAFVVVTLVAVLAAGAFALAQARRTNEQRTAPPSVPTEGSVGPGSGPRIVFRHTGIDAGYGLLASVPLADPGGPRQLSEVPCDRVDAGSEIYSCLVTRRGVVTKFEARELDADLSVVTTHPLPGIPSRTRLSPDGSLVATTSFVTGHSYMTTGFSTATVVREVGDGRDWGNLERFDLILNGREVAPRDRNIWGVTFVDTTTFYVTVATGGRTYLARGDLAARTLTTLTENAECPSLSPDGGRVAFKVDVLEGSGVEWGLAVMDLATGTRTELGEATYGVDDQVEWLDDDTLLYAMPRADEPGVQDVWAVDTRAGAEPGLLIEEAASPSVVR